MPKGESLLYMGAPNPNQIPDPELEAQGRRLAVPAPRFLAAAVAVAGPGLVLLLLGHSWVFALGVTLVVLAGPPAAIGLALVAASGVSRWAARRRPFA